MFFSTIRYISAANGDEMTKFSKMFGNLYECCYTLFQYVNCIYQLHSSLGSDFVVSLFACWSSAAESSVSTGGIIYYSYYVFFCIPVKFYNNTVKLDAGM